MFNLYNFKLDCHVSMTTKGRHFGIKNGGRHGHFYCSHFLMFSQGRRLVFVTIIIFRGKKFDYSNTRSHKNGHHLGFHDDHHATVSNSMSI